MSNNVPIAARSTWLKTGDSVQPAEPLWKRVPTRDEYGDRVSDFMVLIPRLRTWPAPHIERAMVDIQTVFEHYKHAVVFADFNANLNLLWVSVRTIPGIQLEILAAIRSRIPQAVLVGNMVEAMMGAGNRRDRFG